MKKDIHPEYVETQVTCTCGNSFTTKSTATARSPWMSVRRAALAWASDEASKGGVRMRRIVGWAAHAALTRG